MKSVPSSIILGATSLITRLTLKNVQFTHNNDSGLYTTDSVTSTLRPKYLSVSTHSYEGLGILMQPSGQTRGSEDLNAGPDVHR